jgi:hypothetical protein
MDCTGRRIADPVPALAFDLRVAKGVALSFAGSVGFMYQIHADPTKFMMTG